MATQYFNIKHTQIKPVLLKIPKKKELGKLNKRLMSIAVLVGFIFSCLMVT